MTPTAASRSDSPGLATRKGPHKHSTESTAELPRQRGEIGNVLLDRVMRRIRGSRPVPANDLPFYVRVDRACGGRFAQLWFLTRGCSWDRRGACTMCNYGQAHPVAGDTMVESVRLGLESVPAGVEELYISPSGSLLDPLEVPPEARRLIYQLVASFPCSRFSLETRAETVSPRAVSELVAAMGGIPVSVGMGLESSSPWIRRFCINKKGHLGQFEESSRLMHERGVGVYANVALGTAFLTASEAIDDARSTVQWALGRGDTALVFPMHVKAHTLLEWLYRQACYRPPSLWSLIEVLASIRPEDLPRVNISWYQSNYGDGSDVIDSPSTCPRCQPRVLELLDRFRDNPSSSTVADLVACECECKGVWRKEVASRPERPRAQRVIEQYENLARAFNLMDWWSTHQSEVVAQMLEPEDS